MLFGFPKGNGSEEGIQLFRKRLARALGNLGLKASFVDISRGDSPKKGQRKIQVLGLLFLQKEDGTL